MRFTIVVTTRNRCGTLRHSLRSCLEVEHDDYEILVSDNRSDDDTAKVLAALSSPRLRVIAPSERLSMAEHRDYALSHVHEGFVTMLGDDDAMLPHGLRRAEELIRSTGTEALSWRKVEYCRPEHVYPPLRGFMSLPLLYDVEERATRDGLRGLFRGTLPCDFLPCMRNSFVSMELVERARRGSAEGVLFDSAAPDVHSGIAVALFTDRHVHTDEPLSVKGVSEVGHGTALPFPHVDGREMEGHGAENAASKGMRGLLSHPRGLVAAERLAAILRAKENYPELLARVPVDMGAHLRAIARDYAVMPCDGPAFADSLTELLAMAEEEGLRDEVESIARSVVGSGLEPEVRHGLRRFTLSFDSRRWKVENVHDAARLAGKLLAWTTRLPRRKTLRAILRTIGYDGAKRLLASLRNRLRYRRQYGVFKATHGERFAVEDRDRHPCLDDAGGTTSFDKHYVYHTAWAARKLAATRPAGHVDFSSLTMFSTLVSAFVPMRFYDYRPVPIELEGLSGGHADLRSLPFADGSLLSVSCMHVVEHVGLGRYGDPLDPDGDLKAMAELARVVAPGGNLFFVVPVGKAKIHFNAHRIYAYDQVLAAFPGFELVEFALVPDRWEEGLIEPASKAEADFQDYGCGCFWFRKKDDAHGRHGE